MAKESREKESRERESMKMGSVEVESRGGGECQPGKRGGRLSGKGGRWAGLPAFLARFYPVILALYPLRHIHSGLDLWDTGYNYANFEYMGLEHMDSMWLFSTYLANAVGHLLMKLPLADSLVGMNFYTGLFVSFLAVTGYLFCTRKLGIPEAIAFVGEFLAVSLCWCPTASLYNYLTYVLFLGGVILLYLGLAENRSRCLFWAGVCLGANVLVRFPNLAEAAMIVAVWAYGVIEALEKEPGALRRTVRRTLWCLGGYLAALAVLLGYLQIRYGLDAYVSGISRLFSMTDQATDYQASSMLMGILGVYVENLYWVIRIGVILAAGVLLFALFRKRAGAALKILWAAVCIAMLAWLYLRGFCSLEFYSYGPILRPGVLFLMLTMLIGAIRIFRRDSPREEKLISGLVILVVLITSIGSNNGVYPSMNNLFVAAPYALWECWRFLRYAGGKFSACVFPVKGVMTAFLALVLVQSVIFGARFVFVDATGGQDMTDTVDNNERLRGVKMSPERAEWMRTVSDYVEENGLEGREVILYGYIPSLSYYLQMPSAFNPWSDLDSYSLETMRQDLAQVTGRPAVLVERTYAVYREEGREGLVELGLEEKQIRSVEQDEKWKLLVDYMEENGYEQTFSNGKFVMWE